MHAYCNVPLRFVCVVGAVRAGLEDRRYLTRLNQPIHDLSLPRQLRSPVRIPFAVYTQNSTEQVCIRLLNHMKEAITGK